jgi:prevent-host-death family protein
MHSVIVGKRDFIQHTSKYLKLAEHGEEVIVTHQNQPTLRITPIKKKSIKELRGLIKEIKIKGDINDPSLPGFDKW